MSIASSKHPIWLAGFRPFFILACIAGFLFPGAWGFVFSGTFSLPSAINPLQWHAHEMLFGFGAAVLIGFLLTASKNWVSVRGIHGLGLMGLVGLWILERFFIYGATETHPVIKHVGQSLFLTASGGYIAWTLIKNRKADSFKDNYFFLFLLAVILLSKNLLVSDLYYQHGIAMSLGLFRLAFTVMFERTMPQFMKTTENFVLYRNPVLNFSIKALMAISVFQSFLPNEVSAVLLLLAAMAMFFRWVRWQPQIGFKKFGNGVMYLGYFGLVTHLLFESLKLGGIWSNGAFSTHVFTFLCMGIVIPGMLVRISKGHTGRKPEFQTVDKVPICIIFVSSLFRLILPLIFPAMYATWILIAGLLWSAAFLTLGLRITPYLLNPRIDGKEH